MGIISLAFAIRDDIAVEDCKKYPTKPENGVLGYGMFLEGARWCFEEHTIKYSRPKELYTSLPMINFIPVADRVLPDGVYNCPLYKVLSRKGTLLTTGHSTNFVMNLELPSSHHQDHWIKASQLSCRSRLSRPPGEKPVYSVVSKGPRCRAGGARPFFVG